MPTMRDTAEIAEKILACIPDDFPEKTTLRARFKDIEKTAQPPNPEHAAPEIQAKFLSRRLLGISMACQEVLGSPQGCDWKLAVVKILTG